MTTGDDIVTALAVATAKIATLSGVINATAGVVDSVDTKLDEVALNIQNLINAGGGNPAQLLQILNDVNAANTALDAAQVQASGTQTHAEAVLAEADTLDGTP